MTAEMAVAAFLEYMNSFLLVFWSDSRISGRRIVASVDRLWKPLFRSDKGGVKPGV
jgi:hypothetical protein